MKNYDEVKRAAEAALKGLIRTIDSNLNDEDCERLLIELSMTLFTASVNFDLPADEFMLKLSIKQCDYIFTVGEKIVEVKAAIDEKGDKGYEDYKI